VSTKTGNPVTFPPGWAKLATRPLPTGSPKDANTIGMVVVSRRTVSVTWFVLVTITLGVMPISSLAKARVFSGSPSPPIVNPDIAPLYPTQTFELLPHRKYIGLSMGITVRKPHENTDPPHTVRLLRPRS
jgi:hypothetical protein